MPTDRLEDEKSRQRMIAAFESRRCSTRGSPEKPDIVAAANNMEVPDPGDLSDMEAKLAAQVNELDVLFAEYAKRAARDFGGFHDAIALYMRFALKAQAQCRAAAGQANALRKSRLAEERHEAQARAHDPHKFDEPTNGIRQNA